MKIHQYRTKDQELQDDIDRIQVIKDAAEYSWNEFVQRVNEGTAILEMAGGLIDRLNQVEEDLINAKFKLNYYYKMHR